jgi:hypothetical protein
MSAREVSRGEKDNFVKHELELVNATHVAEIGSDTRCSNYVVKGELIDFGRQFQQK